MDMNLDRKRLSTDNNENTIKSPKMVSDEANMPNTSKFVDGMIKQWLKTSQNFTQCTNSNQTHDMGASHQDKRQYDESSQKIVALEKHVMYLKEINNSLSDQVNREERLRDQIMTKFDATWEACNTVVNHVNYITECLMKFRQRVENISGKTDNVLQKHDEMMSIVSEQKTIHDKMQEQLQGNQNRIIELQKKNDELLQNTSNLENKYISEKDYLLRLHAEEKNKLLTKLEVLEAENKNSKSHINQIEEFNHNAKQIISDQNFRISELQNKIEHISLDCQKNRESLNEKEELINKLESNLKERSNEKEILEEKLQSINEINGQLLQHSSKVENEIQVVRGRYKQLESILHNTNEKLIESEKNYIDLKNLLENNKSNEYELLTKLQNDIKLLQEEKEKSTLDYNIKTENYEKSMIFDKKNHEKEITNIKNRYEIAVATKEKLIDDQKSTIEKVSEKLSQTTSIIQNLRDTIMDLQKEKEEITNKLSISENKLSELKNYESQMKEKFDQLNLKLKNEKKEKDDVTTMLKSLENALNENMREKSQLKNELNKLFEEIEKHKNENIKLKSNLIDTETSLNKYKTENYQFKTKLEQSNAELEKQKTEIEVLHNKLANSENALKEFINNKTQLENQFDKLSRELINQNTEKEELKRKLLASEDALKRVTENESRLKQILDELNTELRKTNEENDEWKRKLINSQELINKLAADEYQLKEKTDQLSAALKKQEIENETCIYKGSVSVLTERNNKSVEEKYFDRKQLYEHNNSLTQQRISDYSQDKSKNISQNIAALFDSDSESEALTVPLSMKTVVKSREQISSQKYFEEQITTKSIFKSPKPSQYDYDDESDNEMISNPVFRRLNKISPYNVTERLSGDNQYNVIFSQAVTSQRENISISSQSNSTQVNDKQKRKYFKTKFSSSQPKSRTQKRSQKKKW